MDNHEVLVGWSHHELDERIVLTVQTRQMADKPDEVDVLRMLMTKNQAAVLGNYLFQIAGQTPPSRDDRSWFRRLFG